MKKRHICSCCHCKVGLFDNCVDDEVHYADLDEQEKTIDKNEEDTSFPFSEFVQPGSYAAMYSTENSFEPFIVFEV